MVDLEMRLSGFDEETFRQRFGSFGGVWIDVSKPSYHSYDHSHLDKESAQELSRVIAEAIKQSIGEQAFSRNPQAGSFPATPRNPTIPERIETVL
jgi:hypothetical protein